MPDLNVIHEDAALIAVAKPAGQLVIPGRGEAPGETLVEQVAAYLGAKAFVVHRLDREASGLVLFAKDAEAHKRLSRAFEERSIQKTYRAAVLGQVKGSGFVDQPIREFGSGRMGVALGGKASLTRYKALERYEEATLLEVKPETGRRHQIRVHLYSIGHPILGDTVYGKERPVGKAPRLMLHAYRLEFESLNLRSDPPADFQEVLAGLRGRKLTSGAA